MNEWGHKEGASEYGVVGSCGVLTHYEGGVEIIDYPEVALDPAVYDLPLIQEHFPYYRFGIPLRIWAGEQAETVEDPNLLK